MTYLDGDLEYICIRCKEDAVGKCGSMVVLIFFGFHMMIARLSTLFYTPISIFRICEMSLLDYLGSSSLGILGDTGLILTSD